MQIGMTTEQTDETVPIPWVNDVNTTPPGAETARRRLRIEWIAGCNVRLKEPNLLKEW